MNHRKTNNILELYKLDYEKGVESALKLENTKLTYQKYFMTLVTSIGSIAIAFLKFDFLKSDSNYTIEDLIGLLLIFSSVLGYIIIRNLVSIRRQAVWFNNAIIYLRSKLIDAYKLTNEFPQMKQVPENAKSSADYITIILCSLINLVMWGCGFFLFFELNKLKPMQIAAIATAIMLSYIIIHYYTIEKLLRKGL